MLHTFVLLVRQGLITKDAVLFNFSPPSLQPCLQGQTLLATIPLLRHSFMHTVNCCKSRCQGNLKRKLERNVRLNMQMPHISRHSEGDRKNLYARLALDTQVYIKQWDDGFSRAYHAYSYRFTAVSVMMYPANLLKFWGVLCRFYQKRRLEWSFHRSSRDSLTWMRLSSPLFIMTSSLGTFFSTA